MNQSYAVFTVWDREYSKLVYRPSAISEKKRKEILELSMLIQEEQKKLQDRIARIRE